MDLGKDPRSPSDQFLHAVFAAAGEDGVAAVCRALGGSTLAVPVFAQPGSRLSKLIGHKAAEKVCAAMRIADAEGRFVGGLKVAVPLGENSVRARLARCTEQLLLQGQSVRSIAVQLGISQRTVFKRRAELVAAGKLKRGGA